MTETHDYIDAMAAGDGVLVRMSDNAAATLTHLITELVGFLERGEIPQGHRRLRKPKAHEVRRRMFPDVYGSRAESEDFRARFREVLTDTTPAHRVIARLAEPMPFLVRFHELDDWHTIMGLVRALQRTKRVPDQTVIYWTLGVQEYLVLALDPNANNGWPRPR